MKALHHPKLFSWSTFDEARNVDFNGLAILQEAGNILIDPMPMSSHDLAHLMTLGGASTIVLTTSDHIRAAQDLRALTGAQVLGPAQEAANFPIPLDGTLKDGDALTPNLKVFAMEGSKTPGELALLFEGHTLITGDLIRAHRGGSLMMLPLPKLKDPAAAKRSVARLANIDGIEAVLVGDGWPLFSGAGHALKTLVSS